VTLGLFARHVAIPVCDGEEAETDFGSLLDGLHDEFQPVGFYEEWLVVKIAESMWRLRRATRCESGSVREFAIWEGHRDIAPEGGPGVSFVVGCSVCFVIGWVIHRMVGVVPWWGLGLGLAVIWMWPLRCWPFRSPQTLSVTTQDLVDAAKARKWVKQYDLEA